MLANNFISSVVALTAKFIFQRNTPQTAPSTAPASEAPNTRIAEPSSSNVVLIFSNALPALLLGPPAIESKAVARSAAKVREMAFIVLLNSLNR